MICKAEFRGERMDDGRRVVTYDGLALPLFPAAAAHAGSFGWGDGGARSRALSVAILTVVLDREADVELLAEVFLWQFVAGWDDRRWILQESTVRKWAAMRLRKFRWADRMAFPKGGDHA